jgi:phospholipase C
VALGGTGQWSYKDDYIPHHEPFDYYASTANPHHLTVPTDPSGNDTVAGLAEIGHDTQSYADGKPQFDTPNHQYDTSDFDQLVSAISDDQLPPAALPTVSFLKAPGYEDGHPAYSEPADEQQPRDRLPGRTTALCPGVRGSEAMVAVPAFAETNA